MHAAVQVKDAADLRRIEAGGLDAFLTATTPYAIIERSAKARPDAVAIRYLTDINDPSRDVALSYAGLLGGVRQAANLFRRLGVGPQDAVAILMPHTPEAQLALWGAELAGRACPINPMLRPDHLVSLVRAAGVRVAVVLGVNPELDIWDKVIGPLRQSGCIEAVLAAGGDRPSPGADDGFEALLAAEPAERLTFEPDPNPDAIAAYFHTGGTTGAPKLALHTRKNQAFVAAGAALMYDLQPNDILANGFPLFHVAGSFVYGLSVLAAGGTVLIPTRLGMRNRDFMASIWRQVERHRITVLGGVPTVLSTLSAVPVNADIGSVRLMLTGGSPLPTELAEAFERRIGKPVRNILGMTECAGVVTIEPFHGPRMAGSTGLALPFTEVRAFRQTPNGIDLARPCSPGETGIIALRGPNVGPGYSEPAMNAGTFEPGGWLVSGDLGHVDEEGRVFVTGRAKDVIIRGAHNIDPAVIEDALLQHPAVAIAAAIGQPDAYAGELPVAFVTLKAGARVSEEELRRFVVPLVSEPAAQPKSVSILDEIPLTPIGKIYKPALRTLATRRAIAEALSGAGAPDRDIRLEVSEGAPTRVRLLDPALEPQVRDALLGMPVQYEIEVAART